MDRIINELKLALADRHGGALLQLNTEETKSLLKVLEESKANHQASHEARWLF